MEPSNIFECIATQVRQQRMLLRLSQEDAAHRCGVSPRLFGSIERAQANPTVGTLACIATGLKVDVATLTNPLLSDLPLGERALGDYANSAARLSEEDRILLFELLDAFFLSRG